MKERYPALYPVLDSQMLSDLQNFYNQPDVQELKRETNFKEACNGVSTMISYYTDLIVKDGMFRVDKPYSKDLVLAGHFWCEDVTGRIIDLTAIQFNEWLDTPLPEGVLLVNPGDDLYKRYMPANLYQPEPHSMPINKEPSHLKGNFKLPGFWSKELKT